jgi:hypothetical protein
VAYASSPNSISVAECREISVTCFPKTGAGHCRSPLNILSFDSNKKNHEDSLPITTTIFNL